MKFSFELPLHKVGAQAEFINMPALAKMVGALEAAAIDACFVTDHPIPTDPWLESGGHHSLDPFVALSAVAALGSTIRLHTNIVVLAYRNPFLTAKAVASLDALSAGRVILGIGAGYLEGEFQALGVPFAERGQAMDEALAVMRQVWTGRSVTYAGRHFRAEANTALPRPTQQPGPPIWVGGNSAQAIRRAVESCDGWAPFPVKASASARVRTAEIASIADLKAKIAFARELAGSLGRVRPFDVCMVPFGLSMHASQRPDAAAMVDQLGALAQAGVTWASISLPCRDCAEYVANAQWFAGEVMGALQGIGPDAPPAR
jgi:probable F420-dependent oxidoreductase